MLLKLPKVHFFCAGMFITNIGVLLVSSKSDGICIMYINVTGNVETQAVCELTGLVHTVSSVSYVTNP